jgi:PAS domain-containing protein
VRGRGARASDPLGELLLEINQLADTLHAQRIGSLEANALLRRVIDEIDVAVLAFDSRGRAVLANRFAERLLGVPLSRLLESGGLDAARLGLAATLLGETPRTLELQLPGGTDPFDVRRSTSRLGGLPISCWYWPTCDGRCARRSDWRGSGWCASWDTRSTTRSRPYTQSRRDCASRWGRRLRRPIDLSDA